MKRRFLGVGLLVVPVAMVAALFAEPASAEVDVDEVIAQVEMAGYECPPWTTYCRRDAQCDGFCGGVGAGACEFGCCYCSM